MTRAFIVVCAIIVALTDVRAAYGAIPYRAITPFDVPNNTILSDLSPRQRDRARALFAQYRSRLVLTAAHQAHPFALLGAASHPKDVITTVDGRRVDAKALYLFLNVIEKSLNARNQTLRDPHLVNVNLDNVPGFAPALLPYLREAPATSPSPPPTTSPSPAPAIPSVAPTPAPCPNVRPKVNLTNAWTQIKNILDGVKVSRCALDFANQLDTAESNPPSVPSKVSLPTIRFGAKDKPTSGVDVTDVLSYDAGKSLLTLTSNLQGSFLGHNMRLASIVATVTSPKDSSPDASLMINIGNTTAYSTKGSWTDLNLTLAPQEDVSLFDQSIGTQGLGHGVRAHFAAKAHYRIDARVQTYKTAAFLDVKPALKVTINSSFEASAGIVSGGLEGTLDLVDSTGDFGGIAAVFSDATQTTNPPVVAVAGPLADYRMTALRGSLQLYFKTAFSKKKYATIATWKGTSSAPAPPTFWTAYRLSAP